MKRDALETLVVILAHSIKRFVVEKPSLSSLLAFILADGIEVKQVVDELHSIPEIGKSLDPDRAQELSMVFAGELGDAVDKTIIDDAFSLIMSSIASFIGLASAIKRKHVEGVIDSVYTSSKLIIRLIEVLKNK